MNKLLEFERVSVAEAAAVGVPAAGSQGARHGVRVRARSAAAPLAEATVLWLASLPDELAPRLLPRDFPWIADELCALWKRPSRCERYFTGLILDTRQGRAGFPPAVMRELTVLQQHYVDAYPSRASVWSHVRTR